MRTRLLLLPLLTACASEMAAVDRGPASDTGDSAEGVVNLFRLSVEPISNDVDGRTLLPQSFGPFVEGEGFELRMAAAVRLTGRVVAERLGPWGAAATLPTTTGEASGRVAVVDADGRVRSETRSDAEAGFSLLTLPGSATLTFSPEDPRVPAWEQPIALLGDERLDLSLGVGLPMWGRVLDADGEGAAGALVEARSAAGATTAVATTDADGWYELRAGPGSWTVRVLGRDGQREPSILGPTLRIDDEGGRADVQLAPARSADVVARLVDDEGDPVAGARVRLTTSALQGYEVGRASFEVEILTDSQGWLDTRLPAGKYALWVLPEDGSSLAPLAREDLDAIGTTDLGTLVVPALQPVSATVVDATGVPQEGAPVQCREASPDPRTWSTTTGADGVFLLAVPDGAVRCAVSPPGERDDLARILVDITGLTFPTEVLLPPGEAVSGSVVIDETGAPLARALVSLHDEAGDLRALHTSDTEGAFSLRVHWSP